MKNLESILAHIFLALILLYHLQAHLDPTDIISQPYPLESLAVYVSVTFTAFFLFFTTWWEPKILLRELMRSIYGTILFWGVQVLCGAHPLHNIVSTVWSSIYMTTLVSPRRTSTDLLLLLNLWQQSDPETILASSRLHGTLLVAIPFQVLHILDWGAQVQRWPLPVIVGCTYGWIVGTLGGLVLIKLRQSRRRQEQKKLQPTEIKRKS